MKTKRNYRTLTINRKKWWRGKEGSALLKDYSDKMCCLGFDCKARGFSEQLLRGRGCPSNLMEDLIKEDAVTVTKEVREAYLKLKGLVTKPRKTKYNGICTDDTELCQEMMQVNDDREFSDEEREARLKPLFLKSGVKVRFVG